MASRNEKQTPVSAKTNDKPRFQVLKLEERIGP